MIVGSPNWSVDRGLSQEERAEALVSLAGELQRLLVPVRPSAAVRERVRRELAAEAGRPYPRRAAPLFQQYRRVILIAAAAVGSLASIAGVILAIVQRNKHARSTHAA